MSKKGGSVSLASNGIATYDDKVKHIELVAQRGAEARKFADSGKQKLPLFFRRQAVEKIFIALADKRRSSKDPYCSEYVLSDTPNDRLADCVSPEWAAHVKEVFVNSYLAGVPKPTLPTS